MSSISTRGRIVARGLGFLSISVMGQVLGVLGLHNVSARLYGWAARNYSQHRAIFQAERAMSAARMRQSDKAVQYVSEAIASAPGDATVVVYRAWVYEELTAWSEAIQSYEAALAMTDEELTAGRREAIKSRITELRKKLLAN